jgi:hypothetical protein
MSGSSQLRDILDANSTRDQQRRVQETPIPYRKPQNYKDQQIMMGNKRPYENIGEQVFGNAAKFSNTMDYALDAAPETFRGQVAAISNNSKALNASLERQAAIRQKWANPDSGVLGAGTIFNNEDEMMNLGNAELVKRIGGNTLGNNTVC